MENIISKVSIKFTELAKCCKELNKIISFFFLLSPLNVLNPNELLGNYEINIFVSWLIGTLFKKNCNIKDWVKITQSLILQFCNDWQADN